MSKHWLLAAVALTLGACATTPVHTYQSAQRARVQDPQPRVRSARDVITIVDMRAVGARDALEAIQRLRPDFLAVPATPAELPPALAPVVFLDGVRQGSVDLLLTIPIAAIAEIRLLSASAAREWFGVHHARPAIVVRTRP